MFFHEGLGNFYKASRNICMSLQVITNVLLCCYLWCKCNLLLLSIDTELNSGTKQNSAKTFSIYHWNLNSIAAQNFAKLVLLKTCSSVHKFGFKVFINRLIPALHLMITFCEFQDIIWCILIIHLITSVEVFVFIIRVVSLYESVYWYQLYKQVY